MEGSESSKFLLRVWDLDSALEVGISACQAWGPAAIVQLAGGRALLRQDGKLLILSIGIGDGVSPSPQKLLSDACRVTGLHVGENQDVEKTTTTQPREP